MSEAPRSAIAIGLLAAVVILVMTASCSGSDAGSAIEGAGDVYRVEIEACAGVSHQRATAMAVGPNLVATAAHTLDTARGVRLRSVNGEQIDAEIEYLDFERDVALLAIDADNRQVFSLAEAFDDAKVTIPTYADRDGIEFKEATVLRSVAATLDGEGRRRAVELAASIDQGDSGAPVVDGEGRAVGMVFASARRDDRGWAVAAAELTDAIDALASGEITPPPSRCRS